MASGSKSLSVLVALLTLLSAASAPAAPHPITFDDFARIQRVSDPQLSPDGKWIAYAVTTANLETNQLESNLWLVEVKGGTPKQLTQTGQDKSPRWSPDGSRLAFLSTRSGKSQIFLLPMQGGEPRQLTNMPNAVDILKWSPNGTTIAFTSATDPRCTAKPCGPDSKIARVYERWPYWLWTRWLDGKRSHLFVISTDGQGAPKDMTSELDYDVPRVDMTDGSLKVADINFSPDSKEICFTASPQGEETGDQYADLFVLALAEHRMKRITVNRYNDVSPIYSPDGAFIAYRAQLAAGTAARYHIMLYDRHTEAVRDLTETFDRSVSELQWAGDGSTIYFTAENETLQPIYAVGVRGGGAPRKVVDGFNGELSSGDQGRTLLFTRTSTTKPAEIFVSSAKAAPPQQITHHNDALLSELDMSSAQTTHFQSGDAAAVQALLVRPPGFSAGRKYPMVVLLHGGPHTMWGNTWSYRWNPQMFAAPGYVVLMINRRGSSGYGQKFTDEVVTDWGGKAYVDIMSGLDATLREFSFIDGARVAAAGASYGGYMADWLATHTGRFKAIVSHAGVFDMTSMYATDIPWFSEFEMHGTPWDAQQTYRQWSPAASADALGKFRTPVLVTAGEKDYRVPVTQSLELFSTLQRQGVPSKLVVFPDEGHWILKPKDSQVWYQVVLDWLATYLE